MSRKFSKKSSNEQQEELKKEVDQEESKIEVSQEELEQKVNQEIPKKE